MLVGVHRGSFIRILDAIDRVSAHYPGLEGRVFGVLSLLGFNSFQIFMVERRTLSLGLLLFFTIFADHFRINVNVIDLLFHAQVFVTVDVHGVQGVHFEARLQDGSSFRWWTMETFI